MTRRRFEKLRKCIRRLHEEYSAITSWWLHEMREVAADLQHRVAPGRPHRTTLLLSSIGGTITQEWRNGSVKSAEFQCTPDGNMPEDRSGFWPTASTETVTVHVVLPLSATLIRHLWLPAGAEKNLPAVVELQLERELPIPRDQVQADWRIEGHNRDRTRIRVAIAIVRRREVERLQNALSAWRLRIVSIAVALGSNRTAFNFSPRRAQRSVDSPARTDRLLLISAAVLLLAYPSIVGVQWMRERSVVGETLTKGSTAALRVERMRSNLAKRREPIVTLQRLMAAPTSAEVLADLTAAVPADSWVQQLEIHTLEDGSCTIKLIVITPVATSLVDRLARWPHFAKVELQTAVSWGLGSGRDRAQLLARWLMSSPATGTEAGKR